MTKEQAINYLRASGFTENQIKEIVKAIELDLLERIMGEQNND